MLSTLALQYEILLHVYREISSDISLYSLFVYIIFRGLEYKIKTIGKMNYNYFDKFYIMRQFI